MEGKRLNVSDVKEIIDIIDPTKIYCTDCKSWKDKETAEPFFVIDSVANMTSHISSYRCQECREEWEIDMGEALAELKQQGV